MSKLRISPFLKQCFVTAAVCFTTIAHGNTFGLPAILLTQLEKPDSDIIITKEEGSWIASVSAVTLLIGSFMAPPIMGRLGRKFAHLVVIAGLLLGWVAIVLAKDIKIIILGRTIHGMSFGLMLPLRSVLIGEYTSPKNRGAFLTAMSFSQGFGILLIHFVGSLVIWQHAIFIISVFPIVSLLMTFFTPETPSWLADKGRYEKSRSVFRWLRGDGEEEELEAMINTTSNRTKKSPISNCGDLARLVKKKKFYKPILIMFHCYMMTEFSGGALMSNYSSTVIRLVAGPEVDANFWMVALDIQRSISSFVAVFIVRKVRRRVMLITTGSVCALSNLAIACYIYTRDTGSMTYTAPWLPLLLINIQFFTVAVGLLTLPYVIAGEIFPLEYRSIGGSISIIAIASGFFLVTKTFPALVMAIGADGTYALYGGWLLFNLIVISFMLPETKGKTLQQIEEHFQGKTVDAADVEEVRQPLNNSDHPTKYAHSESTNR